MIIAVGYAAKHPFGRLRRFEYQREDASYEEVDNQMMFCGICHFDIYAVKTEWHNTVYPCVPGHEAAGRVTRVGCAVVKHQVDAIVSVGSICDSCRQCSPCLAGEQNYCECAESWLVTCDSLMGKVMGSSAPSSSWPRCSLASSMESDVYR